MGICQKSNYKTYWSKDDEKSDIFIKSLQKYAKLSARKFRKILSCIRMYDKEVASVSGLNNKKSDNFDEHYKVCSFHWYECFKKFDAFLM